MTDSTNYKVCSMCGSLVDNDNMFNVKGNEICKTCVEKKLEEKVMISPLGTFICSLIPGVGQIFLGKKQKGLFLLSMFILNIFLFLVGISILTTMFFPILACITYFYSLFDANISRKYIESNTYVDSFIDKLAYNFFKCKTKKYLQEEIIDKRLQ